MRLISKVAIEHGYRVYRGFGLACAHTARLGGCMTNERLLRLYQRISLFGLPGKVFTRSCGTTGCYLLLVPYPIHTIRGSMTDYDVTQSYLQDISLGTSIIAVSFKSGVVLGADSRTSSGSYVANRVQDKITPLADFVYLCRSGSASDTQAIASYVQYWCVSMQMQQGGIQTTLHPSMNLGMEAYRNTRIWQRTLYTKHQLNARCVLAWSMLCICLADHNCMTAAIPMQPCHGVPIYRIIPAALFFSILHPCPACRYAHVCMQDSTTPGSEKWASRCQHSSKPGNAVGLQQ